MKYILNEEEYNELLKGNSDTVQMLCSFIADNVLVKQGVYVGEPWGCVLTFDEELQTVGNGCGYCDECPAEEHCPYEGKEFSQ